MLRALFSDLFRLRVLTGVDLRLLGDGQMNISYCSLRIKGDQLGVTGKSEGLKHVLHFSKQLKPGPIALHISGRGVLTKKLDRVEKLDQQVIHQLLPNANSNDFYVQHQQTADTSLVSLIRRKEADELMAAFDAQGFTVIALSLAAFTENAAYQAAFQVLVKPELVEAKSVELSKRRTEVFAKAKLMGIAMLAGPLLLVLLLLNFFLFTHYSNELQACSARSTTSAASILKYRVMEQRVGSRTAFIKQAGWTGGLDHSFMVDQLMADMPGQIKLNELAVNPIADKVAGSMAGTELSSNTVKISGSCSNAGVLNDWLFSIKANPWAAGCSIDNYVLNTEDGRALFSITITLGDDEK